MNKLFFVLLLLFVSSLTARSQSIVGTWKRTGNILEKADGTKKDMQKLLLKSKPCMAGTRYIFEAGGRQYSQSLKGCGINDADGDATWKINGNTITLTSKGESPVAVVAVYTLVFNGNTVTFTHIYNAREKEMLHSTASKIIMTYERI